jgi:hypothetical protein
MYSLHLARRRQKILQSRQVRKGFAKNAKKTSDSIAEAAELETRPEDIIIGWGRIEKSDLYNSC